MLRTVQNGELPGRACCLNGQYVSRGGKNHGLAASFLTQVGVAQATEGPTRVLSTRQVDVGYLELSSATTCRGNQSMHAIRLLGLRHGL